MTEDNYRLVQAMTTHAAARLVRELLRIQPGRTDLPEQLMEAARRLHPGVDAACAAAEKDVA